MPATSYCQKMDKIFFRLESSQTVALKLMEDQGIDSPWILSSLSDKDMTTICNVIRRPGGAARCQTRGTKSPSWQQRTRSLWHFCGLCMAHRGNTVSATSSSFCWLASLKDFLSSSSSQSSLSGHLGTSCPSHLPSPPYDELMRFMLLVCLDLIFATSYATGVHAVVSLATQAVLSDCYGQ